jgi:hypothetical protein
LNKDVANDQFELIMDSVKTAASMLGEFDSIAEQIVSNTALEMSDRFRNIPLQVRQELVVLLERHHDNPDQMLIALDEYNQKLERICNSPFSRLQRWLCGGGNTLSQNDWIGMAATVAFFIFIPVGVWLVGQTIQIFTEPPTPQVQSK